MTGAAVSVLGFGVLAVAGAALAVSSHRRGAPATAGAALTAAMRTTSGRVAVFLWWIWFGVHFLAR